MERAVNKGYLTEALGYAVLFWLNLPITKEHTLDVTHQLFQAQNVEAKELM